MRLTSPVHQGWGRTVGSERLRDAHVGDGWWFLLFAAWCVIVLQILPMQTATAAETSGDRDSGVEAAILRADSLVELFEYDAAAKVLEKFLVSGQPIETKIRINTKLASIYEQNLNEQQAINCLLDNLRTIPTYKLPDSLRTQLQRLYDKALAQYGEEKARQNRSPKLGKLPTSKTMLVGEMLQLRVVASDPEGDAVTLSFGGVPGATLEDKGNGTGRFTFTASSAVAAQQLTLVIYADDGRLRDSALVLISIAVPRARGEVAESPWWKSLIVPGSSQYFSGHRGIGGAFFVGTTSGILASTIFTLRFNKEVTRFNDAMESYLIDGSETASADATRKFQTVLSARKYRNAAYVVTILVYSVNAVQAYFHSKSAAQESSEAGAMRARFGHRPRLRLEPRGVYLCLDF